MVGNHDVEFAKQITIGQTAGSPSSMRRRGITAGGISAAVSGVIRLNHLDEGDVSALRPFLHLKRFEPGEIIMGQGDASDGHLYFLLQGEGIVEVFGEQVGSIQCGSSFGELALNLGLKPACQAPFCFPATTPISRP